jgi:hypothetical protein
MAMNIIRVASRFSRLTSLWTAKPWGYHTIFIGGVFCSLDKLQFLMSGNVVREFINTIFHGQEPLQQAVGIDTVTLSLILVVLVFVLGRWGFACYA